MTLALFPQRELFIYFNNSASYCFIFVKTHFKLFIIGRKTWLGCGFIFAFTGLSSTLL